MSVYVEQKPITDSQKKVLRKITIHGERTYYDLYRKDKVASNKTVQLALQTLENAKLIQPKKKTEGTEKKPYVATLKGLLNLLIFDEEAWRQIDQIAKKHRDKLLIFKKWQFFKEQNLKEKIIETLRRTLATLTLQQLSLKTFYFSIVEFTEEEAKSLVDSMTLGCHALRYIGIKKKHKKLYDKHLEILKACKKDEQLRSFVESELNLFEKIAKARLSHIQESKKLWVTL